MSDMPEWCDVCHQPFDPDDQAYIEILLDAEAGGIVVGDARHVACPIPVFGPCAPPYDWQIDPDSGLR